LLAAPAAVPAFAAETWLGEGFPPVGSWLMGNEDPTKVGLIPQWLWWTWGWDRTNKTKIAAWPELPRVAKVSLPQGLRLVPPKEYDHPYKGPGELQIVEVKSQDSVHGWCPTTVFPKAGAFACAIVKPWGCQVVIAPEADLKAVGLWKALVVRHETAHCNGWPGDHRGALPVEDWAPADNAYTPTAPPPVLNAASHFDKFALSVVTKTVAEVAGNLDQRAAQFIMAAKAIGLAPESQLTGQVLSNPATAVPLARAAGIGTDRSDEQWRQAHALAFQASKARQAENAAIAAQQAQPASRHCGLAIQKRCE
jgi:hypothetical protein